MMPAKLELSNKTLKTGEQTTSKHTKEKMSMVDQLRMLKDKREGRSLTQRQEEEFKQKYGDKGAGNETMR